MMRPTSAKSLVASSSWISSDRARRSSANAEMLRYDDRAAIRKRTSGRINATAIANRISRIVSARDCTRAPSNELPAVLAQIELRHYRFEGKRHRANARLNCETVVQVKGNRGV